MVKVTVLVPQGVSKASVKLPRVLFSDATWKVFPVSLVTEMLFAPSVKATVPLGFTVKLMVPPLCFENVNGLGLVDTVTMHGVGVGFGSTTGVADGDGDGDVDGLAPGLGSGLGDGPGSPPGDGVGVGFISTTSGVGLGDGEVSSFGVGVGLKEKSMPTELAESVLAMGADYYWR